MIRPPPTSTLFPYTTLFRSDGHTVNVEAMQQALTLLIRQHAPQGHGSEVAWGLWMALSFSCAIEDAQTIQALSRSEEHTSELQSPDHLVCRLLLEKKKQPTQIAYHNGTYDPMLAQNDNTVEISPGNPHMLERQPNYRIHYRSRFTLTECCPTPLLI